MQRAVTKAALIAALMLGVSGTALAQEKIVISQWDAYWPADLLANFTKETGIEAEWAVQIDNEDMMGKVTASGGKGYDVVFASGPFVEALDQLGLIAELDHGKIPNLANLYPAGAGPALRSRQQAFGALYLGHHRPVLSQRPGDGRSRPAGTTC